MRRISWASRDFSSTSQRLLRRANSASTSDTPSASDRRNDVARPNDMNAVRNGRPAVITVENALSSTSPCWMGSMIVVTLIALIPLTCLGGVHYFGRAIHHRFERIQKQFRRDSHHAGIARRRPRVRAYRQEASESRGSAGNENCGPTRTDPLRPYNQHGHRWESDDWSCGWERRVVAGTMTIARWSRQRILMMLGWTRCVGWSPI